MLRFGYLQKLKKEIYDLKKEIKDNKLVLLLINFPKTDKYVWNIKLDTKEIQVTSKIPIITLSKSNTKLYLKSNNSLVTINEITFDL